MSKVATTAPVTIESPVEALLISDLQASALLGDSRAHFRNLVRLGLAPRGLKCGHLRKWRRQELLDWVNEGMPPVGRWRWRAKK